MKEPTIEILKCPCRTWNQRFTKEQVESIRRDYSGGNVTQWQLADKFNIGQGHIWNIINKFKIQTPEDRFWSKVLQPNPPESWCWVWTGKKINNYGRVCINHKSFMAHRISWILHFGPIPDDASVLHHCDNPPCIRPDHLFLGDAQANVDDMIQKGRDNHPSGESCPVSKLTHKQVVEIRRMASLGHSWRSLANTFRLKSKGTIGHIIHGRTWV